MAAILSRNSIGALASLAGHVPGPFKVKMQIRHKYSQEFETEALSHADFDSPS
jgi:hypothetical protein